MSQLDEITKLSETYLAGIAEIEKRREQWSSTVKDTIVNALTSAKLKLVGIPSSVEVEASNRNLEIVALVIATRPANITLADGHGVHGVNRIGGQLHYTQGPDGRIRVIILEPHFNKLDGVPEPVILHSSVEPELLTESAVLAHVVKFFKHMISLQAAAK